MKLQGKLSNWNDKKGFGFVEPNGGGQRAFVHIKAFASRSRRPANGDVITYELERDKDQRYRAINVRLASDSRSATIQRRGKNGLSFGNLVLLLFGAGLTVAIVMGKLPLTIAALYVAASLFTFAAYAIDKSAAQSGSWRTKETTLHLFSLIGGWPGALLAQKKLRHKSRKTEFKVIFWITVLLNLAGLVWLTTDSGVQFLSDLLAPYLQL